MVILVQDRNDESEINQAEGTGQVKQIQGDVFNSSMTWRLKKYGY